MEPSGSQDLRIPLAEEEAFLETRRVSTGKVRVRSQTDTIEDVAAAVLEGQHVEVTRVPIDEVVTVPPAVRTEGDVTIVPVLEEVLFVEKRLVLKEELHIRRLVTTETVEVAVTRRRQRAVVERVADDGTISDSEE